MRKKKWNVLVKRLKRMMQRISLIHESRRLRNSIQWHQMKDQIVRQTLKKRLKLCERLRQEAEATALDYVNELMSDEGYTI